MIEGHAAPKQALPCKMVALARDEERGAISPQQNFERMNPIIPQHVLDWCEANNYDKPSVAASSYGGAEYWAIAPGSFMPERMPLTAYTSPAFTNHMGSAAIQFADALRHELGRAATQFAEAARLLPIDYTKLGNNLAIIDSYKEWSDRDYIRSVFAMNQKHPGRSISQALVDIRIQEFCQAHRLSEKQLAVMLKAGTVQVRQERLQPAKGFRPAKAPNSALHLHN